MLLMSPLLRLPGECLLFIMLWALLLPWMYLLWIILLLVATSTIVVALGGAFVMAAPATDSAFSPGPAAAHMDTASARAEAFLLS